jgi:acyl-coenzyme A thioesterase PaaI-like protein
MAPHSTEHGSEHFELRWCNDLLARPDCRPEPLLNRRPPKDINPSRYTVLTETLNSKETFRAFRIFTLHLESPGNLFPWTECMLVSLGDGMDMDHGRLAGGITATIFDTVLAMAAMKAHGTPMTIKLEVQYKRPVQTPCVVLCNVWVIKIEGRWCWLTGVLENGEGKVYATCNAVFARFAGDFGDRFAKQVMDWLDEDTKHGWLEKTKHKL